jgi:uncharacterized protein (TIGR02594 family)
MKDVYQQALLCLGLHEKEHNKMLKAYLSKYLGKNINPATTPWCAAFVNAVLDKTGYKGSNSLMARSFLKVGRAVPPGGEELGDIVVLRRGRYAWQGHVGFLSYLTKDKVCLLGGNQNDKVSLKLFPLKDVLGIRRLEK